LVGLKENVILGHFVPVATGFQMHQEAAARVHPARLAAIDIPQEVSASVEAANTATE
jgi:hypothetical protein